MFSLSLSWLCTHERETGRDSGPSLFLLFFLNTWEKDKSDLLNPTSCMYILTPHRLPQARWVSCLLWADVCVCVCVARGANGIWLLQNKSKHKTIGQQEQKHRLSLSPYSYLFCFCLSDEEEAKGRVHAGAYRVAASPLSCLNEAPL